VWSSLEFIILGLDGHARIWAWKVFDCLLACSVLWFNACVLGDGSPPGLIERLFARAS
jgi:hypothetical protein